MLIFAGNSIPPLWNSGDKKAFVERMIPIKFESPVLEADKITDILDKISMEYIIKESVERLYGFLENNKVFTQPAQSKAIRKDILETEDIVYAFVQDCDTSDTTHKIHTRTLFEIFQLWAERNGYAAEKLSSNIFTRKLKELGFENKKVSVEKSVPLVGFIGIKPPSIESLGYWGTIRRNDISLN